MSDSPVRKPKRNKPGAYHKEYSRDASPLLSRRPTPLNETGEAREASDSSPRLGDPPPEWHHVLNRCGLVAMNLVLFGGGACVAGFLLFFHNFFVTLWWSLFASGIVLAVLLMLHGLHGVIMLTLQQQPPSVPYALSAVAVAASVVATVTLFMITWNDLSDTETRDSLSGSFLSQRWEAAVQDGGHEQANLCSLERDFSCRGWHAGCSMVNESVEQSGLFFPGYNDSLAHLADLIENFGNFTQLGNCPICFFGANATKSCSVAIADFVKASMWFVLGVGFLVVCMVALNVVWAVRSSAYERRALVTSNLLDAQRYL
jgi:hypothetical protein